MRRAQLPGWPSSARSRSEAQPLVYRWRLRRPRLPFAAPYCHGRRCQRVSLRHDSWRCRQCATRISPERLHHRLLALVGKSPFDPERRPLRSLFQVHAARSPWRGRERYENG